MGNVCSTGQSEGRPVGGAPAPAPAPVPATPTDSQLTFYLNGKKVVVGSHELHPRMTLLDYLRDKAVNLKGTKASCTQGGCGACTVMLSSKNQATNKVEHKSVNACLRPLMAMEGQHVMTTEGIRGYGGNPAQSSYHPVQERIADCNGTQCGFCTPGHVMAMYSLLREKPSGLTEKEIEGRFDGVICRCTGYRSIMKACHSFADGAKPEDTQIAGDKPTAWESYDASKEAAVPPAVAEQTKALTYAASADKPGWNRPTTMAALTAVAKQNAGKKLGMVCGGTSIGVYPEAHKEIQVFVDISAVKELAGVKMTAQGLEAGATTSLSQLIAGLEENVKTSDSYDVLARQMKRVANWQVRNVGSWAGNLVMARTKSFASDIATLLAGAGAKLTLFDLNNRISMKGDVKDFVHGDDMKGLIIQSVTIPKAAEGEVMVAYRTAMRPVNAHAFVNSCFRATVSQEGVVSGVKLCFGVVQHKLVFAEEAQKAMEGKKLDGKLLEAALQGLDQMKIVPETQYHCPEQPEGKDAYRRNLTRSFVYKFFLSLLEKSGSAVPESLKSAAAVLIDGKATSSGKQVFETTLPDEHPGKNPRPKFEAKEQAAGRTVYHEDISHPGQFHAVFVPAMKAPAKIVSIDWSKATAMPGVVEYVDNSDAKLAQGSMAPGEALFVASGSESLFVGHPVGCIIAETRREAEEAAKAVVINYGPPEKPGVYSIEQAHEAKSFAPSWGPGEKTMTKGDVAAAFSSAGEGDIVVEGTFSIGGQQQFPMEKNTCHAAPDEQGRIVLHPSTQMPDHVRFFVAANLGIPIDKVQIIVRRLGGSFGAKTEKSFWTAMASAVCSRKVDRAVVMQNSIHQDMMMYGTSRHKCAIKYKAAMDNDGMLTAFEIDTAINGGRATGFTAFVAGEILENIGSVYNLPNLKHELRVVVTNTATGSVVRGPGIAQAIILTETIIQHLAAASGKDVHEIRCKNMCTDAAATIGMFGATREGIQGYNMPAMWERLTTSSDYEKRKAAVADFNAANKWKKRGISMVPMKYGNTWVYGIGTNCTISIQACDAYMGECPAVKVFQPIIEMGQGVTTKVQMTVASALGCLPDKVYVCPTNTDVLPNGGCGATAGSVGSESACAAADLACQEILQRLGHQGPAPPTTKEFIEMVKGANGIVGELGHEAAMVKGPLARLGAGEADPGPTTKINLTATAVWNPQFADVFCAEKEGCPITYFTMGAAVTEVEVDVLSGEVIVHRTDMLYDAGHSLNPVIDIGQAEGCFVMGQGFMTQEETIYQADGQLTTDSTWEYKPPLNNQIPSDFRIELMKDSPFPKGVKRSKAVGEPPLMLAASVHTAVREAIKASRVERGKDAVFDLPVPASVDRIQSACAVESSDLVGSI